ncbi:ribosomal protein L15 [Xylona heveae TC161]|uniref:Ribosomal protein L15 n=1 Tax=Xylona heveae (strain CBS 132557 / TC161) TaxID=1328760 RepID=A0A165JWW2_XYLHT|nr:ribosomal protein L15 [Xylona heveae TC161]KZF26726.1 ribosomal protein L15 [Xylona heveae TC161]
MPPRLNPLGLGSLLRPASKPLSSLFAPIVPQQPQRAASILSSLSDNTGAYNKRIRRGRGPSSGKGKTSGRGHKGQKQHGKVPAGFNGGQTPNEVVHGPRGFDNQFSVEMSPLNIDRLQSWIDQGRLDPSKPITMKELNESRCLHGVKDGVKLLARGAEGMRTPVNIVVSRASAPAIAAIEAAGGTVISRFYTKPAIRRILHGQADATITAPNSFPALSSDPSKPFAYRLPDPTSRKDIEYYRDPAHRGYLNHLVKEGEGPSLFFKSPAMINKDRAKAAGTGANAKSKSENKLW